VEKWTGADQRKVLVHRLLRLPEIRLGLLVLALGEIALLGGKIALLRNLIVGNYQAYHTEEECCRSACRYKQGWPIPPDKLPETIRWRRRACLYCLIVQIALDIMSQPVGRLIAPVSVLLQCLQHYPVQLGAQQATQFLRLGTTVGRYCRQRFGRAE